MSKKKEIKKVDGIPEYSSASTPISTLEKFVNAYIKSMALSEDEKFMNENTEEENKTWASGYLGKIEYRDESEMNSQEEDEESISCLNCGHDKFYASSYSAWGIALKCTRCDYVDEYIF